MKILISSDGIHAHYFQRMAWANAFRACGFNVAIWDCKKIPAFDAFDSFEPDIFMGQSYNLNDSILKCIYERPHLKVALRSGDWGDNDELTDKSKDRILFCSELEKRVLEKLKSETGKPDFVHIHYSQEAIQNTHNRFADIGINVESLMMCADTFVYSGAKQQETLKCDIGFVGGYWPYKGVVINEYLFPLLQNIGEFNVKIFGNQPWPANQYCGLIGDNDVKNLFASATVCPNLSEPHAQRLGIDVNERIFKILLAGGFCVSDYVESYKIFNGGIVMCKTPKDFQDTVRHYINNPQERKQIISIGQNIVKRNHTGFHRIANIMYGFGLKQHADNILKHYRNYIENEK